MNVSSATSHSPAQASTSAEVRTAQMAKSQQEVEGKIALDLIQSGTQSAPSAPVGNAGHNINIKV